MLLFSQPGPHNTNAAAVEGIRKAKQLNTDLVFASSSGATARIVIAEARKQGFTGKLIDVRSVSDDQARGVNRMDAETKRELEAQGVMIVTAGHALSSGERGLSRQFSGVYPLEIMAATLRTLGQGFKVCFECAVMALDAGLPLRVPRAERSVKRRDFRGSDPALCREAPDSRCVPRTSGDR